MPNYTPDPENPAQRIDTIELLRRNPLTPPPVHIEGLLRRDLWTRQEALLILCGLDPRNKVDGGYPLGTIGAGLVYLDGTTSAQLDAQGLQHPRAQEWLPEFDRLKGYAAGQDMGERKPPSEWITWAEAKGFRPYWLDAARVAGFPPGRLRGESLGSALLAEPQAAPAEQAETGAGPHTMGNSTKGKRRHPLETPIEAVRDRLSDPDDASAIVAELEASNPTPFLGKRGKRGGLAYTDPGTGSEADFSVKNCRDYLRPRKRGTRA